MKYTIILYLCFIVTLACNAQAKAIKLGEQAVFTECKDNAFPYICTLEKFENDITALITPQFTVELKDSLKADYFSVSIILLTDENGMMVPEETDILCHYEPMKKAVKNYLYNLPAFYPKGTEQKDRRSVFTLSYTFLYTSFKGGYFPASQATLANAHIKEEILPLDSYPAYKGCRTENDQDDICFRNTLSKLLTKKMRFPDTDEKNKIISLSLSIEISKTGIIEVKSVTGADASLADEVRRVMKKMPKVEPAKVRGLPVTARFTIPLTATLNKE